MKSQNPSTGFAILPFIPVIILVTMLASCAPRYGCYYGMTSTPELSQDQPDDRCLIEPEETAFELGR